MTTDAKYARTIAASIAQVGSAIQRFAADPSSVPPQSVKDGCAAALRTTKEAVDHVSRKHKAHAALLLKPLDAACQLFTRASVATDAETRSRFISNAQRAITITLEGAQALEQEIAPIKQNASARVHGDDSMEGLDFLGLTLEGDGDGLLDSSIKAVGGLAKGAIDYAKSKKAEDTANASDAEKLKAAISADAAATIAVAQAMASADVASRDSSKADAAEADKMFADSALAAQDKAGAALPASQQQKRIDAAQTALDAAQKQRATALRGGSVGAKMVAQFTVKAAQQTLAKAQAGGGGGGGSGSTALVKSEGGSDSDSDGALGFLTKKLGPLPRYAYAVIAGAAYGGYRVLSKRKK